VPRNPKAAEGVSVITDLHVAPYRVSQNLIPILDVSNSQDGIDRTAGGRFWRPCDGRNMCTGTFRKCTLNTRIWFLSGYRFANLGLRAHET
jgi:hypothetical protein